MKHRSVLTGLLVAIVLIAGCSQDTGRFTPTLNGPAPPASDETYDVTVERVIDGDTVDIEYRNGTKDTVQLLGVDTPETNPAQEDPEEFDVPDNDRGKEWLLTWEEKAKSFTRNQLQDEQVKLVISAQSDSRDDFGRLLAFVLLKGKDFNRMMLEKGLARVYDTESVMQEAYFQAETRAQDDEQGVWEFNDGPQTTTMSVS